MLKFPLTHELRVRTWAHTCKKKKRKVAHIVTWAPPTHTRAVTTTAAGEETKKTASLLGQEMWLGLSRKKTPKKTTHDDIFHLLNLFFFQLRLWQEPGE